MKLLEILGIAIGVFALAVLLMVIFESLYRNKDDKDD